MKLINRIFFTALMVMCFSIPMAYSADHHGEAKTYRQTQLTDTIFLLQGKGGNIALIKGEQGLILIDTDYKEMSAALEKVLQQHGGLDDDVSVGKARNAANHLEKFLNQLKDFIIKEQNMSSQ